jgi:flagellar basal body P-ring formation protein FlgA
MRQPLAADGQRRAACSRSNLRSRLIDQVRINFSVKKTTFTRWHTDCSSTAMKRTTMILCSGTLAFITHTGLATEYTDPAAIRTAAETTIRAQAGANASQLTLQVAPLDARLRVAACDRALTGFVTGGSAVRYQTTVGVRCEGSVRWTVYTSVSVESQTSVLVARRSMTRDVEVTAADFRVETRRVPGLASAYVSDPAALAGQRLGRLIASGDPLSFETLAPANLIHRGQHVMLLAHVGELEVRMGGVALADGRASERIKVQNDSSQRVVEGIVRSANEVETPL